MSRVSGRFIDCPGGSLFALLRRPGHAVRESMLVVPPFAEELNKSRRMITETSLALLDRNVATVIPDLFGTGDSEGDFRDARWGRWLQDLRAAADWAAQEGFPVSTLLAVRLGAALAVAAVITGALPPVRRTVLWQPVFDGARHLKQFLRLRVAAGLMDDRKETVPTLLQRLDDGESLEVAGYELSPQLASELGSLANPACLPPAMGDVFWLEIGRDSSAGEAAKLPGLVENSRSAGRNVSMRRFAGEPYWASTEVVVNNDLIDSTVESVCAPPEAVGGDTRA